MTTDEKRVLAKNVLATLRDAEKKYAGMNSLDSLNNAGCDVADEEHPIVNKLKPGLRTALQSDTEGLVKRLRQRALEAGYPKNELYEEAAEALTRLAEDAERYKTLLLGCRGAVKSWLNKAEASLLHKEYPAYYKPMLEANAQRAQAMLDAIDALSRPGPDAPPPIDHKQFA